MADLKNEFKKPLSFNLLRILVIMAVVQSIFAFTLYAQTQKVKGIVTDAQTGETLPTVNVSIKGTSQGTITLGDGNYEITVTSADAVLIFSYVGYKPMEVAVNGRSEIDVQLEPETTQLDEVVAIGYGTTRKRDFTGSIASLNAHQIKKIPSATAAEAIKGRLPGVNIISTDGSPDAEVVIRVRGGGSVTQDNSPLYVVDGFIVESIRDIPPSDIANISVLKDAASTAIYGAQAANGVIIITTKSPTAGRTQVAYNGYSQIKTLPRERAYEVLDPYEFVMVHYERAKLRSDADLRSFERYFGKYEDLELYKYKKPTDWQDELFGKLQVSQSHNLSISGGTEKTKVSLSLNNNIEDGIMIGNGFRRNVINFKINHEIAKSLIFEGSARITNTRVDGAGTTRSSQLRIKNIVTARPVNGIADELDIDLSRVDTDDDYQSFLLSLINPVQLAEQDWRQRTTQSYVLQAGLTWDPVENLIFRSAVTGNKNFDERLRFYGPLTSTSQQQGNSLPMGGIENNNSNAYRWLNTANYTFQNLGNHTLDFMVGHEVYSVGGFENSITAMNFRVSMTPEEMFANMALGNTSRYATSQSTEQNRLSFFGRANYQFLGKYLATFTVRTDMSSKFSKGNRTGVFPAVALAWKMEEEEFLANAKWINELKLRISYGTTGNDRIPANATKFLFSANTSNGPGMGTNGYNAYYSPEGSTLYNPNILWETTVNRNLGSDFAFYKWRISGSLDLYYNTTRNLLLSSAISPISGFNTQWNNIGSTSNKGVELLLNTMIVDKDNFTLSANVNFGFNKSRIEELDGTDERFFQSNWSSTDLKDRDDYYLRVGETIGLIYGYVNDGMYTVDDFSGYNELTDTYVLNEGVPDNKNTLGVSNVRPGYMKLKDLNQDGEINSQDRQVIGSTMPDAIGGFGMDATYKGFDASLIFTWTIGNDLYNTGLIDYNQLYRTTYGNMLSSMSSDQRFTYIDVDGSITGIPGEEVTDLEQLRQLNERKTIWSGSNSFGQATTVLSDWAIEDGSFLRLSTVTLGYTFPAQLTSRIRISNLRVYVAAYNLWLWTKYSGYDPEVSTSRSDSNYSSLTPGLDYSSYPRSRAFTLGVNLTF